MSNFVKLCKTLEEKIQAAYTEGVTMEEAEKLAGEFLYAQIQVSAELKDADMNARMRKTGVKAVKASLYLQEVQKSEKKPTETHLTSLIDSNELVQKEQDAYDAAEVDSANLERYYNIFREGHIHFRGIAKGRFE